MKRSLPAACPRAPVVAPLGDEEPHRDQDDLEGEEEEQQVEGDEGGEHADLEDEQQGDEGARGAASGRIRSR